jgi:hypothetical protein
MSIIIKQTFCQNFRVESAIVLVHEQYLILSWIYYKVCINEWYKKSLKSFFTLTIAWGIAKSPSKIGYIWIKSDFRLICGYFIVTGIHNKTENDDFVV